MIIIKRYQKFTVLWLANAILLYLASMFMPANFTLGNNAFSMMQAALFTGFVWNYVLWNSEAVLNDLEVPTSGTVNMMVSYLVVNFASLWLLARFAFISGFGVSSYVYVLGLAVVANLVQYALWQTMDKGK